MKSSRSGLESKMRSCLDRLGIPLKVLLVPEVNKDKHGEIVSNCLFIYDHDEREAWLTFEHELYEYKFKEVTYAYRTLINGLIESFEKLTYERKEKFLDFLPQISKIIEEERV